MGKANALHLAGIQAAKEKNFPLAITLLERAKELDPSNAALQYNLGNLYRDQGNLEAAEAQYRISLKLRPRHAATLNNLGLTLKDSGKLEEVNLLFQQAIDIDPSFTDAAFNLGVFHCQMKALDAAEATFQKVLETQPNHVDALKELATLYQEKKSFSQAIQTLDRLIEIDPNNARNYLQKAMIEREGKKTFEALANLKKAFELDPNNFEISETMGLLLTEINQDHIAVQVFKKILDLNPNSKLVLGQLLHSKMRSCHWAGLVEESAKLIKELERSEAVVSPFAMLSITDSPPLMQHAARLYTKAIVGQIEHEYEATTQTSLHQRKIKIGYFSADFYAHATSQLLTRILELHDRNKFELIAFSMKNDIEDYYSKRVKKTFDHFIKIQDINDVQVTSIAQQIGIDIAVDLKGYTKYCRPKIFANRVAPVQINYLGYPGTMGTKFMDYIIADQILIPESMQRYYDEKVIYLPYSYQPNDDTREISDRIYKRTELSLPENAFVFCCFNYHYKITPFIFDIWCHFLTETPGSVLWLLADGEHVKRNLGDEAARRGIDPQRLIFAARVPPAEHLSRIRQADLFLDTLPCNAHTTASDALWAGLPVLTCKGDAFHSRVASSLLSAIGLEELSVDSIDDYIEAGVNLSRNPAQLKMLREKLIKNKKIFPLFDSARYTKNLETAYLAVFERHHQRLCPEHIYIN